MKRQNMLERSIVLVSGPDCFSREYVCVCVTFRCFMGPMRLQKTMAVQYSAILHCHIIKFLKNTLHLQCAHINRRTCKAYACTHTRTHTVTSQASLICMIQGSSHEFSYISSSYSPMALQEALDGMFFPKFKLRGLYTTRFIISWT